MNGLGGLALLEADVNYGVVKNLLKRVKDQALGDAVIKSVSPGQQFIKIVHDELVQLMIILVVLLFFFCEVISEYHATASHRLCS